MKSILFSITLMFIVIGISSGQIQFQENKEVDEKKANVAGRVPLYAPNRCKNNELLYPGDQANDWVCDCAPAHIYHPDNDGCYPAFRRGPCENEQILVLGENQIIPQCINNPCKIDGQIPINSKCYEFDKSEPCQHKELSFVLGVDPKTLKVDCIILTDSKIFTRFGERENKDICSLGTKCAYQAGVATTNSDNKPQIKTD